MLALLYQPERGRAREYTNSDHTNDTDPTADTLDTPGDSTGLDDTFCMVSRAPRNEEDHEEERGISTLNGPTHLGDCIDEVAGDSDPAGKLYVNYC